MSRKKLKFNLKGFEELRHQPKAKKDLRRRAEAIAKQAGGQEMGYKVTDLVLEDPRGAVSVMATGHAARHNRKTNALIRAMGAGRD